MVRARIRRGSVALAAALVGAAANAGEAHAWENWYCGTLIYSSSWCSDYTNHTYDYNRATYGGSGSVWVCARLRYKDSSSTYRSSCGYDIATNSIGTNTCCLYEADVKHESGSARHTIQGYAIA